MLGGMRKGSVMGMSTAVAVLQRVTCIATYFLFSAAQVTAANVRLSGTVVLRVPAVPGVDLS